MESALRTVVGPELRLSSSDQQSLARYARLVRYGTDEIVQHAGVVPMGITFVIAGSVRLTVTTDDGSVVAIATLKKGTFLGLTALTRQPDPAGAVALEEVTALQIGREHLEQVVMNKPMLLQELGRVIDERQRKAQQAIRRDLHQSPAAAGEHRGPARRRRAVGHGWPSDRSVSARPHPAHRSSDGADRGYRAMCGESGCHPCRGRRDDRHVGTDGDQLFGPVPGG